MLVLWKKKAIYKATECTTLSPHALQTPDMQLIAFKGLIEHILNHCRRVLQHINPIFQRCVNQHNHFVQN